MSSFTSQAKLNSIDPNDCNVPSPGGDGISSLSWSPTANYLVSTNWDAGVRCWEVQEQGGQVRANPMAQVNHDQKMPVLDSCFSADGSTVFSVGADKAVRMWRLGENPPNGIAQQIGMHDAPAKTVGFLPSSSLVVSGGWDRKVRMKKCCYFLLLPLQYASVCSAKLFFFVHLVCWFVCFWIHLPTNGLSASVGIFFFCLDFL